MELPIEKLILKNDKGTLLHMLVWHFSSLGQLEIIIIFIFLCLCKLSWKVMLLPYSKKSTT